jgi:methyl-accepting chemotaxis protein
MGEQSRALKEITAATSNIGKQIRLVATLNREHSNGSARLLEQLKSIRSVSERNTRGVLESRGTTTELVERAKELRTAINGASAKNGRNGRRSGVNGR